MRHSRTSKFMFVVNFTIFCLYKLSMGIVKSTMKLSYRFGARGLSLNAHLQHNSNELGSKMMILICGLYLLHTLHSVYI